MSRVDAVLGGAIAVGHVCAVTADADGEVVRAVVQLDHLLFIKARHHHAAHHLTVLGDDGGQLSALGSGQVEQQRRRRR